MAVRVEAQPTSSLAAEAAAIVRRLDFVLLAAVAALVAYGLWVLGAVSRNDVPGDPDHYVVRQGINVALAVLVFAAAAAVAVLVLHRTNIRRLRAGTENRFRIRRRAVARA